jgi:uncharacterized protein (DUF342 family)
LNRIFSRVDAVDTVVRGEAVERTTVEAFEGIDVGTEVAGRGDGAKDAEAKEADANDGACAPILAGTCDHVVV